jgi:hypothetical protein
MNREPRAPYRIFETEEDFQAAVEAYIGERVAKLQRAIRRAEKRAAAAEEELAALTREVHTGGTPLQRSL